MYTPLTATDRGLWHDLWQVVKKDYAPRPDWFNDHTKEFDWDAASGGGVKTDIPAPRVSRSAWMSSAKSDPFDVDKLLDSEIPIANIIESLPFDRFIKREIYEYVLPPRMSMIQPADLYDPVDKFSVLEIVPCRHESGCTCKSVTGSRTKIKLFHVQEPTAKRARPTQPKNSTIVF
jgi:hypothetical protein